MSSHKHLPFHNIEEWTGTHFWRVSFMSLGGVLYMGHSGHACPHNNPKGKGKGVDQDPPSNPRPTPSFFLQENPVITVIDCSGITSHSVCYCMCPKAPPEWQQLYQIGYFPGSTSRPTSAFTFQVLDYFALDNDETKSSAQAFISKLCRLTNKIFPQDVKVCILPHIMCCVNQLLLHLPGSLQGADESLANLG